MVNCAPLEASERMLLNRFWFDFFCEKLLWSSVLQTGTVLYLCRCLENFESSGRQNIQDGIYARTKWDYTINIRAGRKEGGGWTCRQNRGVLPNMPLTRENGVYDDVHSSINYKKRTPNTWIVQWPIKLDIENSNTYTVTINFRSQSYRRQLNGAHMLCM